MENLKGRLVARKTKLPLKLHGGHAGRLIGDQISAQNQTFSGVWLRSITVPTVSPVFWRHLRQRRTPGLRLFRLFILVCDEARCALAFGAA